MKALLTALRDVKGGHVTCLVMPCSLWILILGFAGCAMFTSCSLMSPAQSPPNCRRTVALPRCVTRSSSLGSPSLCRVERLDVRWSAKCDFPALVSGAVVWERAMFGSLEAGVILSLVSESSNPPRQPFRKQLHHSPVSHHAQPKPMSTCNIASVRTLDHTTLCCQDIASSSIKHTSRSLLLLCMSPLSPGLNPFLIMPVVFAALLQSRSPCVFLWLMWAAFAGLLASLSTFLSFCFHY